MKIEDAIKRIETLDYDSFSLTCLPCDIAYAFVELPTEEARVLEFLKERAKKVGFSVKTFNAVYKAYCKEKKIQLAETKSQDMNMAKHACYGKDNEGKDINFVCYGYDCTLSGIIRLCEGESTVVIRQPLYIKSLIYNLETGAHKVELAFKVHANSDKWKYCVVDKSVIASKSKIILLSNKGINITDENAREVIRFLQEFEIQNQGNIPTRNSISHLGWVDKRFFPYASEDLVFDGGDTFISLFNALTGNPVGTWKNWKDTVYPLYRSNMGVRLCINLALGSLLLDKLSCLSSVVHMHSPSGKGKTVLLQILASLFGNPREIVTSFTDTSVALELRAVFCNAFPLFVDELEVARAGVGQRSFDKILYDMTEGKGRNRGRSDGSVREGGTWRLMCFFTGENPILKDDAFSGAINRTIEFEFDNLGVDYSEPVAVVQENYGFGGERFFKQINDDVLKEIKKEHQNTKKLLYNQEFFANKQVDVMALAYAIDKYVCRFLFDEEQDFDEMGKLYDFCINNLRRKKDLDRNAQAWVFFQDWMATNISHFYVTDERLVSDCMDVSKLLCDVYGEVIVRDNERIYYILPAIVKKAIENAGFNYKSFIKYLKDKKISTCNKDNQYIARREMIFNKPKAYICVAVQDDEVSTSNNNETERRDPW